MSEYVLVRHEDGKMVAPPGEHHSYTDNLRRARLFQTREEAEREACGNESAVPIQAMLLGRG